jgi:hypothetical protein
MLHGMGMNPGVTVLPAANGSASIAVNCNGDVWALTCSTLREAAERAVEARLLSAEVAESIIQENKAYVGAPLQYYPPTLRNCGFKEYPVLPN